MERSNDRQGLGIRTGSPCQHFQQCNRVLQRLWLDNPCHLFAVLIDDGDAFVPEEILNGRLRGTIYLWLAEKRKPRRVRRDKLGVRRGRKRIGRRVQHARKRTCLLALICEHGRDLG